MKRFKNKVAVVTGAGSGIGRSTALRMDSEGANLVIVDVNKHELSKTRSMLGNKKSITKVLDISSQKDVKNFFKTGCWYFLSTETVIVLFGLSLTTIPFNIFLGILMYS